jgi:hypothetical protein
MVTQDHKPKLTEEEFLAIWALTFGYEWVGWDEAMEFKDSLFARDSVQITDLTEKGLMEGDDFTKVRLRTSVAS